MRRLPAEGEPSPFALEDERDIRRLWQSDWVAHVVMTAYSGHPRFLQSTLGRAARLLAGRVPIIYSDPRGLHLTFQSWDGSEHSRQFAHEAGKAAASLLGLSRPELSDVSVTRIDTSPETTTRALAEMGIVPFPRPNLTIVPPVEAAGNLHEE